MLLLCCSLYYEVYMAVYDCFLFFNEMDLLDIRLNTLTDCVDYYVVIEATKTFTQNQKPLYFKEHRSRFSSFLDKIIYVCVDDFPNTDNPWDIEIHQRNAILRGLENCNNDDVIMISDCDEIPNPTTVKQIRNMDLSAVVSLPLFMCYYYMNNLNVTAPYWYRFMATNYSVLVDLLPQGVRMSQLSELHIKQSDGLLPGWHMSCLNGPEGIREKMNAVSHQEYNTEEYVNEDYLRMCIENGIDFVKRPFQYLPIDEKVFLPEYVVKNAYRYKKMIYPFEELAKEIQNGNMKIYDDILKYTYTEAYSLYMMS